MSDTVVANQIFELQKQIKQLVANQKISNKLKHLELSIKHGEFVGSNSDIQDELDNIIGRI